MLLKIKVLPRSSKNEITTQPDGSFKVKLTAAPTDGKANEALIKILAEHFQTSKSKIKIVKGERGRTKLVEVP